jgi:hypothetical protein
MSESQATKAISNLKPSHLYAIIHGLSGGMPNPEEDNPPGPWDPVIRIALKAVERFGPFPEPWRTDGHFHRLGPDPIPWQVSSRLESLISVIAKKNPEIWDIIGGPFSKVALNPQPLPPRFAFMNALGEAVIERVELMQEIAESMDGGGERGIIVVGGRYLNRFTDELCPPLRKPPKFPKPWPPPPDWYPEELNMIDYMFLGATFDRAAHQTANESLKASFDEAASRIAGNAIG